MAYPIRIFRPSYGINDYDIKHLESVRASIAHSVEVLKANPPTDTFAGRKTQEPFPNERESSGRRRLS